MEEKFTSGNERILVTGSNGFVGSAVCSQLIKLGFTVRAAVRTANTLITDAEVSVVGDIDDKTNWTNALSGLDVVIHTAARVHVMHDEASDPLEEFRRVNVAGTEHLARTAATAGVKRLVYVSSIKVNGEESLAGHIYSERDDPAPQDPYGVSKLEAEQALHRVALETGMEVVIVRPPLVYGAGVKGNFAQMIQAVARGIPLPLASINNRRDLLYLGNLVDALLTCASHPAAAGQTYLLSDGTAVSTTELLRRMAEALGVPSRLLPFPVGLLKAAGRITGKSAQVGRLLGSLQVDNGKIRRELDWMPPWNMQQGLQATADWYWSQTSRRKSLVA